MEQMSRATRVDERPPSRIHLLGPGPQVLTILADRTGETVGAVV